MRPNTNFKQNLVFVLSQVDVVQVSSESGCLQPQPALIQPRLQLLTVIEELKQPQLSLQLPPPDRRGRKQEEARGDSVSDIYSIFISVVQ